MPVITQDIPLSDVYAEAKGEPVITKWSSLVDREEATKRETTKLPLKQINWEIYARAEEATDNQTVWIPPRFIERQERLRLYRSMFNGSIGALIPDKSYARVVVNEFRQACLFKADLLTSVEITTSPDLIDSAVLLNALGLAVINLERDGIALLNLSLIHI